MEILAKVKEAFASMPFFMQPGVLRWTKSGCMLDNGCRLFVGVASESVVQGFSLDYVFIDEFAYIPNNRVQKFWNNIYPTLANNPESKCIIASTPNGRNLFWELWQAARNDGKVTGVPTGFRDLDNMLTGMHAGELLLVAARPAMGKTAFVLNIAHHLAVMKHIPVGFFSLEMSKEQLASRILAVDAMVDSKSMKVGDLSDDDWDKVIESTEAVANSPLYIEENSSVTISELRSIARKWKQN
jgi:hypothetical protein